MDKQAENGPATRLEAPGIPDKVRVLLVDDQMIIAEAVRRLLGGQADIEFRCELDAQAALDTAIQWKPTVILQDLVMPVTDGFEMLRLYRGHAATRDIPIILLSSKEDPQLKAQGFATGANDYLVKLPDRLELLARIRYHSNAYISRLQRDAAFDALRESEKKLAEANILLKELAEVDGLTGIANRRRFDDVLTAEWQRALRHQRPLSLLLCDVDFFKRFNDTHGHLAGDACLRTVAGVLKENLRRPADLAARYGGEEFALILPETDKEGALAVAHACRGQVEALAIPNQQPGPGSVVTLSIGAATMMPAATLAFADLVRDADRALYRAKVLGRNCVVSMS